MGYWPIWAIRDSCRAVYKRLQQVIDVEGGLIEHIADILFPIL